MQKYNIHNHILCLSDILKVIIKVFLIFSKIKKKIMKNAGVLC